MFLDLVGWHHDHGDRVGSEKASCTKIGQNVACIGVQSPCRMDPCRNEAERVEMFCVTVRFRTLPEQADRFLRRIRQQAQDSLALEPGCSCFEVWADTARPGEVHLHEIYDDRAAFDAHLESAHFKAFDAEMAALVQEKVVETWDRAA
ncbi:MAG: putative quinol monooxygenase [Pseudomonadota bacterium]